jgi:hypothetical protein
MAEDVGRRFCGWISYFGECETPSYESAGWANGGA